MLRIAARSAAPADSPLGRRDVQSSGRRVTAGVVLPQAGLGRFALEPTQVTRPLVAAPLSLVQRLLDRGDVANVIFAVRGSADASASVDTAAALRNRLDPSLDDYGLTLAEAASEPHAVRLTTRRLILPPEVDRAAEAVLAPLGGRPSLVFLATTIASTRTTPGGPPVAAVPYSTILGIESTSLAVGDLVDADGNSLATPGPDEIVIDRWLADDLAAQGSPVAVGDMLEIAFFLPETVHGRVEESRTRLRVTGIAEMRGAAIDRTLVPEVEGVSDEDSIADWDPPFPFDAARVRTTPPHDEDDRYWKDHGTTPKAFVSLATARRIAGSRFGRTTAWHVPREQVDDPAAIGRRLAAAIRPEAAGLRVVPLAAEARAAARGSTPFGSLFLALSSFIVVAGLLLEWLLFRLLVTARRREIGILAATGWPPRRLAMLLALIGGVAAVGGSVVGAAVGPAWAEVMLDALGRAWTSAVAGGDVPALGTAEGAARPIPVALVASVAISLGALVWLAWRTARVRPLALVRQGADAPARGHGQGRRWLVVGAAALAIALGVSGLGAAPERAVASFFLAGGAALVALVTVAHRWLVAPGAGVVASLSRLARRSVASNPARALAVIAIVAIAEFLVVALSAFELGPPPSPADVRSPTGGWMTIASFGTPVSADSAAELTGAEIAFVRSSGGSDASCTNLYAATRPAVLGVGPAFIARGAFSFVAHQPLSAGDDNPWTLLHRPPGNGPIPAILDQATAQWALKVGGVGSRFAVPDDDGIAVDYEIVGLLAPGILQGYVLVAEEAFEKVYP
ncbi:MAG: ABC transporter permease, partial [Planctomycetia bacterium]|nr:ABC transporter permease [Planctomycetia bacterium]